MDAAVNPHLLLETALREARIGLEEGGIPSAPRSLRVTEACSERAITAACSTAILPRTAKPRHSATRDAGARIAI